MKTIQESIPIIRATVTFLSESEGGKQKVAVQGKYRAHVVVGDPSQRRAIFAEDGRTVIEDYLPVAYIGNGLEMYPGQTYTVTLALWAYPYEGYLSLMSVGTTFTLREGARIVGYGNVLSLETLTI